MTRSELIGRLEAATGPSNELDIAVEIALFEPDERYSAIRANAAGTKVVCDLTNGRQETCWARDWTMDIPRTLALLKALERKDGE